MTEPANPPLALIAGPTASGKSALALALATRTDGVIINADSAQVYRDLPVLSSAPTTDEMRQVEHRLYGFLDGAVASSAADWAGRARREIADVQASGRLPILVGGTGLYLRTLLDGIAPVPPIEPEIRLRVRMADLIDIREQLQHLDPDAAARFRPNDTTRLARALEVILSTGKPLAEWQQQRIGGIGGEVTLHPLILLPPRDWLYERCDARFRQMIDQGAIEEVRRLLARSLDPDLPVMRAIGVAEIAAHLRGEVVLEETIAAGQRSTRRYAKRQYTWFAHQPPAEWPRFAEPVTDASIDAALALLSLNR